MVCEVDLTGEDKSGEPLRSSPPKRISIIGETIQKQSQQLKMANQGIKSKLNDLVTQGNSLLKKGKNYASYDALLDESKMMAPHRSPDKRTSKGFDQFASVLSGSSVHVKDTNSLYGASPLGKKKEALSPSKLSKASPKKTARASIIQL